MAKFIQQLRYIKVAIFINIRAIASYFIPKKKGYYAFFPILYKREFAGNIKALMLYAAQNHKEIKTVLLSKDKNVIHEAQIHGLNTKDTTFGMMWANLRAEHILVDTSTTGHFRRGKFSLIQLWHGSGFKEVVLQNSHLTNRQRKELELINKKYKIIAATSECDAKKQNISFNSNTAVITGYPRNDVFFGDKSHFIDLKVKYNLDKYDKIIAYIPTFRDLEPLPPFSEDFYRKLQSLLEENNAAFVVKKHPADKFLEIPENLQNIKDLSHEFADVQELLLITDVLISDYSSIITDFALTRKPILIYSYDLEQYMEICRPLYYDIEEVLPQPFIKDENDLLEKLKDESWAKTPEAINSYENFIKTFHQYLDGNSSQRVMEAIKKLSTKNKPNKNNEAHN